ncbi:putative reverse transcriptase domain-containing protein [Tanacetum coccineum]|uniref:Reverse transcriptase domain-containing protein n=1 Tax=Tanacetum coccineum TaxID=301880 RepID=A0ABQ5DXJ5_9ASTR
MEEINNFHQELDETLYQAWERFKELLMKCSQHYLTEMQEVILFYNRLDIPTRQILDLRGVIPSKTVADAKNSKLVYKSRQMTVPFPSHLDKHYYEEEEGIYGPKFTEAYEASYINHTIPQKEKDPRSELAHTRLTVELADRTVKYPKGIAKNILVEIGKFTFPKDIIILDMPKDIKVPLILRRPFLSTARSKIDVYKRKITLRVGEETIIFKSVKPASSLIRTVYMLSEVIEEFRARDEDLDTGINDYPSYCDDDKKIHIDCAHNLRFSCMIGFKFTYVNFFPLLYVNVMSKKFHNSIMKDKMVCKGNNVVGALTNVPIFVGTFSVVTDFAVLKNMDAYRDEGMGDVIIGEPFLREVRIKAKWFEGIITLYKNDDEATYQMGQSHPRFKNHTNEQCNKISPLLKVSEKDEKNGISHAYQKLKGFYKGVLNLGPEYIRNTKTKEWLTRGHISVHDME